MRGSQGRESNDNSWKRLFHPVSIVIMMKIDLKKIGTSPIESWFTNMKIDEKGLKMSQF